MPSHIRLLTAALVVSFCGLHLLSLPRSLEDIDTINFALGVESFDVTEHRPHPPGYPVFIAMGKASTALLGAAVPTWDRNRRAAVGLAIWGVLAGSVFVLILVGLWRVTGWTPDEAWLGAALAVVSPLFWFTAARPLTDAVALVGATAVQWVLLRELMTKARELDGRRVVVAAFVAGVLIGVRTQTLWLTMPILAWAVGRLLLRGSRRDPALATAAGALGCLLWAVPLVIVSGGLDSYLAALADQGGEDFANITMLATSADPHLVADSLHATFVRPWRVAWLGQSVVVLALAGLARLLWRQPSTAWLLAVAFVPYLCFHLAFHEVEDVRYALPLIVPTAGFAMYGLCLLPSPVARPLAAALIVASVITGQEVLGVYGRNLPPTVEAFERVKQAAQGRVPEPLVVTHLGMRRTADWYRPEWPTLPVFDPREPAWLFTLEHFRHGGDAPVWWLADVRRADDVLFDPRARHVEQEFAQNLRVRRLIGQARQDEVRWIEIADPGWMLGRGWALSPDVAGVTFASGHDPKHVPADAYLRRTETATRVMIGGRYLAGTAEATVIADIDGREISRWPVRPSESPFVYFVELPPGILAGADRYASMQVRVEPAGETPSDDLRIAFDQFDYAPASEVMSGLASGWHAVEADEGVGAPWRWTERQATMLVFAGDGPVQLVLEGETTRSATGRPSTVTISVDGHRATAFGVRQSFAETVDLSSDLFASAPARVTLDLDQSFVPADRGESTDRRDLGLRVRRVQVRRP